MIKYTKEYIAKLLDKYMDGTSTLDEEYILAHYFHSGNVPEEWEDYRQLFSEIEAMKPKRQKRRWAFWGVAAAAVAGLLYMAVPSEQVDLQPDNAALTAKTDTARAIQPRETEMDRKTDSVEIIRDEPRPMQSRKRRLRKTEPTINDYAKTYTLMAEAAKGQQEAEEQITQCRQELTEARLLSLGYIPVEQEDGTILYINERTKYLAYEE
jgi:hypothetical protein